MLKVPTFNDGRFNISSGTNIECPKYLMLETLFLVVNV